MREELHAVPGMPGYRVTADGRVWSDPRPSARGGWRKLSRSNGYEAVTISIGGRVKTVRVHSMVASAFLGPCPSGQIVRHLNGNPLDNRIENLAYGTPRQNNLDAVQHGTHYWAQRTHCPRGHEYSEENVYQYNHGRRCKTCELKFAKARRAERRKN